MSITELPHPGPQDLPRPLSRQVRPLSLSRQVLIVLVGIVVVMGIGICLYGRIIGFGLRRDEMMFVPPAVLLEHYALYQDLFYNHLPYSAWYFRAFAAVFADHGLLYSARIGVFVGWGALLAVMVWSTWRLSGSRGFAALSALGLVTHQTLLGSAGMAASNNLLQLAPAVLALGIFLVEIQRDSPRRTPLLVCGVALSAGVGIKISAVAFIPPIAIAAFLLPRSLPLRARLKSVVAPVLIGGLVGAGPLFVLLLSNPDLFLAHVVRFHTGPHLTYWQAHAEAEPGLALGMAARLQLAYGIWFGGAALVLCMVTLLFVWHRVRKAGRHAPAAKRPALWVALAALAVTMTMALLPTPGFPQYYIAPLVCLPLVAAILMRDAGLPPRDASPILGAAALMMALLATPLLLPALRHVVPGQTPLTERIHLGGLALRDSLARHDLQDGKIATLLPIYPLEGGLAVYPELATGQFAYRIAPHTPPELAQHYRMSGPDQIEELLSQDPPAAILLGYEPLLEAPLRRFALAHGYRITPVDHLENRYGAGEVFLRPGGTDP